MNRFPPRFERPFSPPSARSGQQEHCHEEHDESEANRDQVEESDPVVAFRPEPVIIGTVMNRREFLVRSTSAAALGLLGARNILAQTPPASRGSFTELRRGVGYYTGRGGTIGWLVNGAGIAAVDSQFPEWAQHFLDGLPGRAGRRVDVLINSHHHGDHVAGNPVFRPVTESIVAHANVPELQRAAAARNPNSPGQVFADTTFETSWKREIGDETITATHYGAAHTGGDVIIHFERANVVHMGDLVFNRLYPVTDRPGGCVIRDWIPVLENAVAKYPADAIYIFGHGKDGFGVTGGHKEILIFRDYLSALLDHVQTAVTAGMSKEETVVLENFPGFDEFHAPMPNRLGHNLAAAYEELTAG